MPIIKDKAFAILNFQTLFDLSKNNIDCNYKNIIQYNHSTNTQKLLHDFIDLSNSA